VEALTTICSLIRWDPGAKEEPCIQTAIIRVHITASTGLSPPRRSRGGPLGCHLNKRHLSKSLERSASCWVNEPSAYQFQMHFMDERIHSVVRFRSWCGPVASSPVACSGIRPRQSKAIEVVFLSADHDEKSFQSHSVTCLVGSEPR
jgi:hypothetical protein